MTFFQTIKYIYSLSLEKKLWLMVFFIGSFVAWLALHFVSMRKLSSFKGYHLDNRTLCMLASKKQTMTAVEMGQVMSMVANNTPWDCKCLSQALCVKWLLNRYKTPSVFYLGAIVDNGEANGMKAHAWVDVDRRTIIGGPQHRDYKIVATFTSTKLSS